MAVRRERLVNDASTTINGAVTATATSIVVTDGSVFPSTGDYRLLIDSEVVLVTARSTNTLTVERGADGTSNTTHSDGATISAVLTAGAIDQVLDDIVGGYSDRYPYRIMNQSGVIQTTANFTWVNQGTATAIDETWGGITLKIPYVTNDSMRILKQSAPSTPWKVTAFVLFGPGYNNGGGTSSSYISLCVRESDTGKLSVVEPRIGEYLRTRRYTNETTYDSEQAQQDFSSDRCWLQIEDDGTNLYFRASSDGINFFETYNHARTAFMTSAGPDEIGFLANSSSGANNQLCHIFAWVVE